MKAHELTSHTKNKKSSRVGRGISAGGGKTAGRGTKGQKSRTGKKIKVGFEGGQTKLSARLPKLKGFKSKNPTTYDVVNLSDLVKLSSTTVNNESLVKAGLIKKVNSKVKLLADGEVKKAYKVSLAAASKTAQSALEKAGGSFTVAIEPKSRVTDNKNKSEVVNKQSK